MNSAVCPKMAHVHSGEESGQLIISKNANIEVVDYDFDRLVPTNSVVDVGEFTLVGS